METRKRFVVQCNWKMHKTLRQAIDYITVLEKGCAQIDDSIEIIVCVPYTVLTTVEKEVKGSKHISVGAQNVHEQDWGSYTGEVSAPMLADAGCQYCMVGHSERRQYSSETDELVNLKIRTLHRAGISPLVLIGETLEEREKGLTLNKIERQVVLCFDGLSQQEMINTMVFYQPVWAIGTGNVARPQQAEEAHQFIRQMLEKLFSKETAAATRVVYGGSVDLSNVSAMLRGRGIDGVGVGAASLDVHNFFKIIRYCSQVIANRKK